MTIGASAPVRRPSVVEPDRGSGEQKDCKKGRSHKNGTPSPSRRAPLVAEGGGGTLHATFGQESTFPEVSGRPACVRNHRPEASFSTRTGCRVAYKNLVQRSQCDLCVDLLTHRSDAEKATARPALPPDGRPRPRPSPRSAHRHPARVTTQPRSRCNTNGRSRRIHQITPFRINPDLDLPTRPSLAAQ